MRMLRGNFRKFDQLLIGGKTIFQLVYAVAQHLGFLDLDNELAVEIGHALAEILDAGACLGEFGGGGAGFAALLLYLVEGSFGLPVFSMGAGIAYLIGPTGGFLLSYPLVAFVAGWLYEKSSRRFDSGRICHLKASGDKSGPET